MTNKEMAITQENPELAKYLQMVNDNFRAVHRRIAILENLVFRNPDLAAEYETAKGAKLPEFSSGLETQLAGVLQTKSSPRR
jgi:hypothetical protein